MAKELSDSIQEQRSREVIIDEFAGVHVRTADDKFWFQQPIRQEVVDRLTIELLLDIRERLAEMREWLPSRD